MRMTMSTEGKREKRGDFFVVGADNFDGVCERAAMSRNINVVAAYLVLVRFSDNRISRVAATGIARHIRISKQLANQALELLMGDGLILPLRDGKVWTRGEPTFEILDAGMNPEPRRAHETYDAMRDYANEHEDEKLVRVIKTPLFLPDKIVGSRYSSPIETLRETNDMATFRLFIELYGVQNLVDYAGIPEGIAHQRFNKSIINEYAQWVLVGFEPAGFYYKSDHPVLSDYHDGARSLELLYHLHLLDFVPTLFDHGLPGASSKGSFRCDDSDRIGESATEKETKNCEKLLYREARDASYRVLDRIPGALDEGHLPTYVLPVLRHLAGQVVMKGIPRLRYIPEGTRMTSLWHARRMEQFHAERERYQSILTEEAIAMVRNR
jgi:hypothetical protein